MRVVQINAIYGSKSTGTIVREIQSCCEANGIDCYVAYSMADRPYREIPRGYHIGNKLATKWHALLSRIFGRQGYFNRLSTKNLLRWLDRVRPDVVHLHNLHSNYIHLNMLLRYLAKKDIATVVTMHDCWYFTGGCTHYSSIGCQRWQSGCGLCPQRRVIPTWFTDASSFVLKDRRLYFNAIPRLALVGVSEWTANEAKKSVLKKKSISYIHNGYDLSIFSPSPSCLRTRLGIDSQFVILGPADKWMLPVNKPALDFFLKHISEDCVFVLFGCSSHFENLPKSIIQIGYIRNQVELAELYSMADVMVNCSREDTLSSINVECQACGTPVVTYDNTGLQETVDGHCGFSVPTGDEKALWEQTMEVKKKTKTVFSDSCRKWVATHFEKNNNFNKYIELYSSLVDSNVE